MRLFTSLAVLVPLVVSVVAAPAKAQTFAQLFDDIGYITVQLSHTSTVAAASTNPDTIQDFIASIKSLTDSVKKFEVDVINTPTLNSTQATTFVKALLETFLPIYAETTAEIVKAKPAIVTIGYLQDVVDSLNLFVSAIEDAFTALINYLPSGTEGAFNLVFAIDFESDYITKIYVDES